MIQKLLLLVTIISLKMGTYSQAWGFSTQIQADSKKIINMLSCNCSVGNNSSPTGTVVFISSFPTIPNIAFGLSNYQGKDGLVSEGFEVNLTGKSSSSFTVQVVITLITNILNLQIRYLAVDRQFPYHLNVFPCLSVNYQSGPLVNITGFSLTMNQYRNTINYTLQSQSINSIYNRFSTPLTNNKVLLFMTALNHLAKTDATGPFVPVTLVVNTTILSTQSYQVYVLHGVQGNITKLHFSMVIFDQANVQGSGEFLLKYSKFCYTSSGGIYNFPSEVITNFLIGFTQLQSPRTYALVSFQSKFQFVNGQFGVRMPPSAVNGTNVNYGSISKYCFTVFYLKKVFCPINTFFNSSTNQCQSCSFNCIQCIQSTNGTQCLMCNSTLGYYINSTSFTCQTCSIPHCISCMSLTQCINCSEATGFYLNQTSHQCQACSLLGCITCINLAQCLFCNTSLGYFLNETNFECQRCSLVGCIDCVNLTTCILCNQSIGYFLNYTMFLCEFCSIVGCVNCLNLTACSLCNESSNYFLNESRLICESCSLTGCLECLNITSCYVCNKTDRYFLNSISKCQLCLIPNCLQCFNGSTCQACNQSANYFLNSINLCQQCNITECLVCENLENCSICNEANNYYLDATTKICDFRGQMASCLNGQLQFPEQCDDGNSNQGDGCSNLCQVQSDFYCEINSIPGFKNSLCFYVGTINLKVASIQKYDYANKVQIRIQISPISLPIWREVDFTKMVSVSYIFGLQSITIKINEDKTISIFLHYNSSIQNKQITVQFDPKKSDKIQLSKFQTLSRTFLMVPDGNQNILFYTQETYGLAKLIEILSYIITGLSLLAYLISLVSGKLIGVQMMAVVQIAFNSLLTLSSLNPCFNSLENLKFVNGLNIFYFQQGYFIDPQLPKTIRQLSLNSLLVQNLNINILMIFLVYLFGLTCFILSKFFNQKKDIPKQNWLLLTSKRCFCEIAFNLILFIGYVMGISFVLELKFGIKKIFDILNIISVFGSFLIVTLIILYFCLIIRFPRKFGEFTSTFEQRSTDNIQTNSNCIIRKWYNILLIERFIIGCWLGLFECLRLSLVFPLSLYIIFFLITIFLRQYNTKGHIIRYSTNLLITIIILSIYLGYSLVPLEEQGQVWEVLPLVICILLLVCVIYSVILLISDIFCGIESRKFEQPIQDKIKTHTHTSQRRFSQQYINKLNTTQSEQLCNPQNYHQITKILKSELQVFKQEKEKKKSNVVVLDQNFEGIELEEGLEMI